MGIPLLILVVFLALMMATWRERVGKALNVARHTKRPMSAGIGPISVICMPFMQTGDKSPAISTFNVTMLGSTPSIDLPSPPPGFIYNSLQIINVGGITAGAGAAAGNGAEDVIDRISITAKSGPPIVDNVRWYAMWLLGFSIDGFTPVAGVMPAATGAYRSEIHVPTVIKENEVVTVRVTCVGAHATYHTTSTAFAGVVRIYADTVPAGNAKNKKRVIYTEEPIDVLGAAGTQDYTPKVMEQYQIFRHIIYTQDTARGTLANDLNTVTMIFGGKNIVPPGTLFVDLQGQTAKDFRRAVLVGIAIVDQKPVVNTAADKVTLLNGAVATVASSGVIHVYLEP